MRHARTVHTERSRLLRRDAPCAEARLWARLRGRRLNGFKFVRQENIGDFYADFVCRDERLVVEVDGATHSTERERAYDVRRENFLTAQGFRVLRVTNADVLDNLDGVCETILDALKWPRSVPSGFSGSVRGRLDDQD